MALVDKDGIIIKAFRGIDIKKCSDWETGAICFEKCKELKSCRSGIVFSNLDLYITNYEWRIYEYDLVVYRKVEDEKSIGLFFENYILMESNNASNLPINSVNPKNKSISIWTNIRIDKKYLENNNNAIHLIDKLRSMYDKGLCKFCILDKERCYEAVYLFAPFDLALKHCQWAQCLQSPIIKELMDSFDEKQKQKQKEEKYAEALEKEEKYKEERQAIRRILVETGMMNNPEPEVEEEDEGRAIVLTPIAPPSATPLDLSC